MRHEITRYPDGTVEESYVSKAGEIAVAGSVVTMVAVMTFGALSFFGPAGAIMSGGGGSTSPAAGGGGGSGDSVSILFHSEWATATGQSLSALGDGGVWGVSYFGKPDTALTVVDISSGYAGVTLPDHWPDHALEVSFDSANDQLVTKYDSTFAAPAVGDSIFYRFFMLDSVVANVSTIANQHGMQTNLSPFALSLKEFGTDSNGCTSFYISFNHDSVRWRSPAGADGDPNSPVCRKVPIRVEWGLHRTYTDSVRVIDWRFYDDAADTLLMDKSFFDSGDGPTADTLKEQNFHIESSGLSSAGAMFTGWSFGFTNMEGVASQPARIYTAFTVSDSTWIGQFVPGGN